MENLSTFQQRLQSEFVDASILEHNNLPDETVQNSQAMCILAIFLENDCYIVELIDLVMSSRQRRQLSLSSCNLYL